MHCHFQLSQSVTQRCSATLFALLIPVLFALTFSSARPFSTAANNRHPSQLVFVAIPQPTMTSATTVTSKPHPLRIEKNSSIKEKAAKTEIQSQETLTVAPNLAKQSNSTHELEVMQSQNHASKTQSDILEKQNKAKAAWAAYQDARSDIQKMASRRGISLQSDKPNKYDEFQTAANNAVIPDCLEKGASSKLGLDSVKGLLVVPALAISALRGKCK